MSTEHRTTVIQGRTVPIDTDVRVRIDYWARQILIEFPEAEASDGHDLILAFDEVAEVTSWRENTMAWGELFSVKHEEAWSMFDLLPSGSLRRKAGLFEGMLTERSATPYKASFDGQTFSLDFVYCGQARWDASPR